MEARRGWFLHVQYPGGFVASSTDGLRVIVTQEQWAGALSRHVSVSRVDRYPTWEELHHVKRWVFGDRCEVVQILPPEEEYVNIHPHCFHLHGPVDPALRWGLRTDLGPERPPGRNALSTGSCQGQSAFPRLSQAHFRRRAGDRPPGTAALEGTSDGT